MNIGKIVCYIHNNIVLNIFNKTLGTNYEKEERVSLSDFISGVLYSIPVFIIASWWVIPLKYAIKGFFEYSDNKYFTCKNTGEK